VTTVESRRQGGKITRQLVSGGPRGLKPENESLRKKKPVPPGQRSQRGWRHFGWGGGERKIQKAPEKTSPKLNPGGKKPKEAKLNREKPFEQARRGELSVDKNGPLTRTIAYTRGWPKAERSNEKTRNVPRKKKRA